jgi:transcriptional repressor NrdR
MNCPYCNFEETKVIDSREGKDKSFIKRRRECVSCNKRFSTIEKIQKLDLEVKKANGEIEFFNLTKIKKGLLKACEKRPVTLEQIEEVLSNIIKDLKQFESKIIPTSEVGKVVLKNLKILDEIAFLKFAIVHNNYESLKEFESEMAKLKTYEKNINLNES